MNSAAFLHFSRSSGGSSESAGRLLYVVVFVVSGSRNAGIVLKVEAKPRRAGELHRYSCRLGLFGGRESTARLGRQGGGGIVRSTARRSIR